MSKRNGRGGFSLVEAIIVLVILALFLLVLAMKFPRQREGARRAACQKNLMQIGVALLSYDQMAGHLPVVPELGAEASRGHSPLKALLEQLGVNDLREISDPKALPPRKPGFLVGEHRVAGFICPSDPDATGPTFTAPLNYRANAGDSVDGKNGVFAPGRSTTAAEVQAGDGLAFTAAFSERLVGTGQATRSLANYAEVVGPITSRGCPPLDSATWKGDAGSTWFLSAWRTTLYQHAMAPNGTPSCIAGDGQSAEIGASSGHPGSVNVLLLDGGVKSFTSTVDPTIWRKLATPSSTPESVPPPGESSAGRGVRAEQ